MSESCTHDCSSCSKSCSDRKPESLIEKPNANSNIKNVIAVVSGKGGVGKTTFLGYLAHYYANQGKTVLVISADDQKYELRNRFQFHQDNCNQNEE